MGYAWQPQVRYSPLNGIEETVDLLAAFTDIGGPERTGLRYKPEIRDREDITLADRRRILGFRVSLEFRFIITTMADQAALAKMTNRLISPNWDCYFSLDGGVTERVMKLETEPSPRPINNKPFLGAKFRVKLESRDLAEEFPTIGSGTW